VDTLRVTIPKKAKSWGCEPLGLSSRWRWAGGYCLPLSLDAWWFRWSLC